MPNTAHPGKHIDAERLFQVAISPYQQLLPEEFEHLAGCLSCFDQFADFVRQNIQDKDRLKSA